MNRRTGRVGAGVRPRKFAKLCTVAVLSAGLSGCASNMTGFEFPSFGLTGQDSDRSADVPPYYQQSDSLSQ